MTAYAVFDCAFLVLLAATGRQDAALVAALGWAGTCGSLATIYYVRLRRSNRRRPAHRRELDRWALAQWTIAPMLVVLASLVFDLGFLRDAGRFLDAAGIATVVGGLGAYLSAAVDWYLILPGVSGIVRPAPCQAPSRERWARVSKLWFFHRGVATILVPFCILGLFFYMAATSEDAGTERLAWLGAIGVVGARSSTAFSTVRSSRSGGACERRATSATSSRSRTAPWRTSSTSLYRASTTCT